MEKYSVARPSFFALAVNSLHLFASRYLHNGRSAEENSNPRLPILRISTLPPLHKQLHHIRIVLIHDPLRIQPPKARRVDEPRERRFRMRGSAVELEQSAVDVRGEVSTFLCYVRVDADVDVWVRVPLVRRPGRWCLGGRRTRGGSCAQAPSSGSRRGCSSHRAW